MDLSKFEALGLGEASLKAIGIKGFEEPTPIQAQAIPIILSTKDDIVGQAQTGTGKTAAFGLPILELIDENKKGIKALVVTPTRELAVQVSEELYSFKRSKKIKVTPIYGGSSIERQIKRLKEGTDIVIGTPGRLIDLINRKVLHLEDLDFLVLDEADEMLNMGFVEDIEYIIKHANKNKRTFLFSATMPSRILSIAKNYMNQFQTITVKKKELTTNLTDQIYFEVASRDKFEALTRIIDIEAEFFGIVFCRTKADVDNVSTHLMERGYDAEGLHGDLSQHQRERVYKKFKSKKTNILVATDVAARGLDVNDLTHVINYSIPQDPESYVHRIGRTGRAGKEGTAITFVTPAEYRGLVHIQKIANTSIRKEQIPQVEDIIRQKRANILEEIKETILNESLEEYADITEQLMNEFEGQTVLNGLLKYFLKDTLSEENYSEIKDVSVDRQGKTRLFVAKGRKDGFSVKKLIDMIQEEVEIQSFKIKEIKIFDAFSFVSMPFEEAETLIYNLNSKNKNRKPIIEHAKPSAGGPSRSGGSAGAKKPYKKDGGYKKEGAPKRSSGSREGRK
ncbi:MULTISPECIES: DEAD/DEAH box helicase [unclassified Fusibacter]|uniref:DEAD/DEAH box helicase n=1 Tax=unclassified Fusibacter TaxID=2624464 RepID=UPI001013BCB6|nr:MULTISPECIES: DEAD/DEAH box helicase [unclassified Fusibacter]MCK8061293.1 DEAD/DEAH box helicase [Fusibacter sp. A2]NPE23510.1 DEAD/DEAH box helicase [Fusibacter sp. A1]RXV59114.1 ATP-dependent helicase [Fusibacter sp. A1]